MLVFSRLPFRVANDHRQLQETIPHTADSQGLTQVVWHRFKALTHFSEASSTFRVESGGRVKPTTHIKIIGLILPRFSPFRPRTDTARLS